MERYLKSDAGVTERLLKGLDVGGIVGRAQKVRGKADKLADGVTQPAQGSS